MALLLATLAAVLGAWCAVVTAYTVILIVTGVLHPVPLGTGPFLRAGPFLGMSVPLLGMWFASLVFLPLVAVFTIAAGLPTHALLAIFQARSWQAYGLAGALVGALANFAVFQSPSAPLSTMGFLGPVAGIGGARAFWNVLRPDRA